MNGADSPKTRERVEVVWGIWDGKDLLPFTIRYSKQQAIDDFRQNSGYDIPPGLSLEGEWRWLKRRGNKCVRVTAHFVA